MFIQEERESTNTLNEYCNHCGKSVKLGSGLFVNRIPDLNDIVTRIINNRKYPKGDFVCIQCDQTDEENS